MFRTAYLTAACVAAGLAGQAAAGDAEVAAAARAALEKNCGRCHGSANNNGGGFDWMFDVKALVEGEQISPGKPDESKLILRMANGSMPPKNQEPRPTQEEIAAVKAWVAAKAPAFPAAVAVVEQRKPIAEIQVLAAIEDHLRTVPQGDERYYRYFSLHHLWNNPAVSPEDLQWFRAAMSKVANSLSWKSDVYVPQPVKGTYDTLFAIDVRVYDWDRPRDYYPSARTVWGAFTAAYPYGLTYNSHPNPEMQKRSATIYQMTGTKLPYIRADWFIATASRPPLYHIALDIPKNAYELEKKLGVDVNRNFLRNDLVRSGFNKSGVSSQNRLIERHRSSYGAYWKSYDFLHNTGDGNLLTYPLGPKFKGNPYNEQAFKQDGGEIVFHLPNKLNGYMLIDGKDNRIDAGPTAVVADPGRISGTIDIVNGISCMGCHIEGYYYKGFADDVRNGHGLSDEAAEKVRRLYPPHEEFMKRYVDKDKAVFMTALDEAVAPFLRVGPNADPAQYRALITSAEPVARLSARYSQNLTVQDAAAELGMAPPQLIAAVQFNNDLKAMGLGPWAVPKGVVPRDKWHASPTGKGKMSTYQMAAMSLGLGSPMVDFSR